MNFTKYSAACVHTKYKEITVHCSSRDIIRIIHEQTASIESAAAANGAEIIPLCHGIHIHTDNV